MSQPLIYPSVPLSDRVDDYHGTIVADPYRLLEDPASPETQAWIAAQNTLTTEFLADAPHRQALHDRLTQLWNYERYSIPRWAA